MAWSPGWSAGNGRSVNYSQKVDNSQSGGSWSAGTPNRRYSGTKMNAAKMEYFAWRLTKKRQLISIAFYLTEKAFPSSYKTRAGKTVLRGVGTMRVRHGAVTIAERPVTVFFNDETLTATVPSERLYIDFRKRFMSFLRR